MSNTKFTKGEWIIDFGHTLGHIKAVLKGRSTTPTVAIYNNRTRIIRKDPTEEEIANACLISSAPDLYEALKEMTIYCRCNSTNQLESIIKKADLALQKAVNGAF